MDNSIEESVAAGKQMTIEVSHSCKVAIERRSSVKAVEIKNQKEIVFKHGGIHKLYAVDAPTKVFVEDNSVVEVM